MEEKQTFELIFKKDLTKLAGNRFGRETYKNQIQPKIDYSKKIVIVFPDRIDRIASSFIQGLFFEIVEKIGIIGIRNRVEILSSIKNISEFVFENLE